VKKLLTFLALLLLAAASPPPVLGPLRLCDTSCQDVTLSEVQPRGRLLELERTVFVDPATLPLGRPLMVRMTGMASAEVRWNGVLIGRNGVPAQSRAEEQPGRFTAAFLVPARLVRAGTNQLSVRLSSHHLWLPVLWPVHELTVGPFETPRLAQVDHYIPALLMLGALIGAGVYFVAAALSDRGDRGARLLAAIAGVTVLQLGVEVARAFVDYSYPWHLVRVAAIALLCVLAAVLVAAYAARRLAPTRTKLIVALTLALGAASLLFAPSYDLKAIGALAAGLLAIAIAAVAGPREGGAWKRALLGAALASAWLYADPALFLDRSWFMLVAAALVLIAAAQVLRLKRARQERDAAAARAAAFAKRLARAEREGEAIVQLKDGSRIWRVAEDDIVSLRAADDYCEATLADGRILLVTAGISNLLHQLPTRFVRVHRSWAVNRTHILSAAPRPGGGRLLQLSNGTAVPVGRSYADALIG
jgi:DNA-binding LytR/AlgR family response regulator